MVDDSLVALGRDEAERNADDEREEAGREGELDGRGEALPELRRDRLARRRAGPELERRELFDVLAVLDVDRLVEPVLVLDRRDGLGRRPLTEQRGGRPSWQRPDPEEDQDRDADEDGD